LYTPALLRLSNKPYILAGLKPGSSVPEADAMPTAKLVFLELSPNFKSGLPDGFFSNQKSKLGKILEGLRWENVEIF
jgi:hypothetical protein